MRFSVEVETESSIFPCTSIRGHDTMGVGTLLWDIQVIKVKTNTFSDVENHDRLTEEDGSLEFERNNIYEQNFSSNQDNCLSIKSVPTLTQTNGDENIITEDVEKYKQKNINGHQNSHEFSESKAKSEKDVAICQDILKKEGKQHIKSKIIDQNGMNDVEVTQDKDKSGKKINAKEEKGEVATTIGNLLETTDRVDDQKAEKNLKINSELNKIYSTTANRESINHDMINDENTLQNEFCHGDEYAINAISTSTGKSEIWNATDIRNHPAHKIEEKKSAERKIDDNVHHQENKIKGLEITDNGPQKIGNIEKDSELSKLDVRSGKLETPGQTLYREAEFDNFDVSTDFKDNSLDDALFRNTVAVTETKDRNMKTKEAMDNKSIELRLQKSTKTEQNIIRSCSEGKDGKSEVDKSLTVTNNVLQGQVTKHDKNNRNIESVSFRNSSNIKEGLETAFHQQTDQKQKTITEKKLTQDGKHKVQRGRKISRDGDCIVFEDDVEEENIQRIRLGPYDLERLIELGF